MRHTPKRRSETKHIIECRRRTQRSHHVRAIGHGQHAQRHRHRRPAAAAACRSRRIEGIARGPVDRVVGMPAQAELGRIAACHEERTACAHALEHHAIGLRQLVREDRRSLGRDHACGRHDVLGSLRKAVQRPQALAARQQRIQLAGAAAQPVPVQRSHQRIDHGVEPVDLRAVGIQHFQAGQLAAVDGLGQRDGRHLHHGTAPGGQTRLQRSGACA
ncbi:MAG: hypothetical protein GAK34_03411 [Delftia tsuruhatensis]|nr:MAG: hypothetical protein GAK34_03411 [Delftia tsuruhatensis]